jgi:hypothetical protein
LEDLAAVFLTLAADSKSFAALLDDDLIERLEVLLEHAAMSPRRMESST